MTYLAKETSAESGAPFFLYQFTIGSTIYRFVDLPNDITFDSNLWTAMSLKHSDVKQSNELSKNSMTVVMPLGSTFADLFVGWSPEETVSFTLYRGHIGETEYLVYWKGRVTSHKLIDKTLEFNCESIFTSLRRSGVRARFTRTCRHSLYGRGCNVNKTTYAVNGFVDSVSDLTLTISAASGYVSGWFNNGIIEFSDGSYRSIKTHVSNLITINRAIRIITDNSWGYGYNYGNLYGGMGVILYPGCDRTISTCKTKFNNLINQGGFKWIPDKNPMSGSSIL